ncbi:hypothetical protein D9M71_414090 [compost metagenome]
MLAAVIQPRHLAGQLMQGLELLIGIARRVDGRQCRFHGGDLAAVAGEGQQKCQGAEAGEREAGDIEPTSPGPG